MITPGGIASRRRGSLAAMLVAVAMVVAVVSGCTGSSKGHAKQTTQAPRPSSSNSTAAPSSSASGSGSSSETAKSSPAPSPGQQTDAAIPLSRTASFGSAGKVTATIPSVRAIVATAKVQGEITGPAFAVTVKLVNDSSAAINLDSAIINIGYGTANTPGIPMSGSPSAPFSGTLASGKSRSAVYVFGVSSNKAQLLRIEVSYSPTMPVVVFTGSA